MKILAFSDWRVQNFEDLLDFMDNLDFYGIKGKIDLAIYAGDDIERFTEKINYFDKICSRTKERALFVVRGNDDVSLIRTKKGKHFMSVIDLHNDPKESFNGEPIEMRGIRFIGMEGSVGDIGFNLYSEKEVEKHLNKYLDKDKSTILVSHCPPKGVLDMSLRFSRDGNPRNIGSRSIKRFIEKNNNILLNICGHCHLKGGSQEILNKTLIVNVSSHDEIGSKGKLCIIDIDDKTKKVESYKWYDTSGRNPKSIRNIYGLGYTYEQFFKEIGVMEIEDLMKWRYKSNKILPKIIFKKIKLCAKSYISRKPIFLKGSGLERLDLNKCFFIDIETDLACEKVWMIGVLFNKKFTRLYAKKWGEEKIILKKFIEILKKIPLNYKLLTYSGTNFDFRVTKNALIRRKLKTDELEKFEHIDVCNLIRKFFIPPIQTYALKDFGSYLDYPFKYSDMNGLDVAIAYEEHIRNKKKMPRKIFEYNKDDVYSIPYIITELKKIEENTKK